MGGSRWAVAGAAALLGLAFAAPASAQYYYPPGGGGGGYYGGGGGYQGEGYYRRPYRRAAMSRVCATDAGVCYQDWQQIGTWCKCGRRETRATGQIVPER